MGLTAQLTGALDSRPLGGTLLASLTGPEANLNAMVMPEPGENMTVIVSASATINVSGVAASLVAVAEQALPILGTLPEPQAILGTLETIITQIESLTQEGTTPDVNTILDSIRDQLDVPLEEGRLALLVRLLDVLAGATESQAIKDLLSRLAQGAGVDLPNLSSYADAVRALDGVTRVLGGMMSLESILEEAQRLSRAMAGTIRPGLLTDGLAAIDADLQSPGGSLSTFVSGVAATDPAEVAAAVDAVAGVAARLDTLLEELAAAMAMGEATLVYLDMERLQADVDLARALIRSADLDPLRALVAKAGPMLQPFLDIDLSGLPPGNLGELLARVEAEIETIAAQIAAIDPAMFVAPLTDGIAVVTGPLRDANQLIAGVTVTLRGALDQVRAAVAGLPFDAVADALRTFLEPITRVLDAITALLGEIEAALRAAAMATTTALNEIDGALTTFKNSIDALFADARRVVEDVSIDEVLGGISQGIQELSDLIAQAQMQPYFDAAITAINAATTVVSAVPFGLLPESMKADVDAAVKPIKDTDADAAARAIEGTLGITEDGRFAVRADIEAAIEDVRMQFLALIQAVEDHHPRTLLAEVDQKLRDISRKVRELAPDLTLQPVRDAIDAAKQAINDIDLDAALQPVRDVFTQIDAALDQYTPSRLVAPLEERIAAARTAVIQRIALDRWPAILDDAQTRGLALLDTISPERIRPLLEDASAEVTRILGQFPRADATRAFGTVIAGLLGTATGLRVYPTSFPVVATWIGGASGNAALAAHTEAIADGFALTRAAVEALDLQAASTSLAGRMMALRTAVQGLAARLDANDPLAVRLNAIAPRLDVAARFAALTQNRTRYLATLTGATSAVDMLRRTGFSDVDTTLVTFRATLEPLRPAFEQLQRLLAAMGIDPDNLSIGAIVEAVLREITPERLTDAVLPLFDAFRGRINALLTAVIAPLKDVAAELLMLINAFTLAPLTEAADGIVMEVKEQIGAFSPDELLREPLASFETLRSTFVTSDPLSIITDILTDLRDLIARVLERLSLETLLESPLAIFDHILSELRKLDPNALLDPLFDQIDALALQVDTGLDQTVDAFKGLQAALPAGGGGSSVSASATLAVA